ncbi:hypothetical protein DL96DRAFT_1817378 [Flagelloscypha sp. PMI_526]|nr:hypothetical protein DL96DRAFT_1817378 [Flagelloscypha sp. PMI_526]
MSLLGLLEYKRWGGRGRREGELYDDDAEDEDAEARGASSLATARVSKEPYFNSQQSIDVYRPSRIIDGSSRRGYIYWRMTFPPVKLVDITQPSFPFSTPIAVGYPCPMSSSNAITSPTLLSIEESTFISSPILISPRTNSPILANPNSPVSSLSLSRKFPDTSLRLSPPYFLNDIPPTLHVTAG